MFVYDQAHALAKALAQTDEYKQFLEAKAKIANDEQAKSMLNDFRRKQWEVQSLYLTNSAEAKTKAEQLGQLVQVMSFHPGLREFLTAEHRMGQLMADVQRIIGEGVKDWLAFQAEIFGMGKDLGKE